MKIRLGFVTNSSSANYVIARRKELSEKQKAAIIDFVEKRFFGERSATTQEEMKDICKEYWLDDDIDGVEEALKDGMDVCVGSICFECCEDSYADLFADLWEALEKADPDAFRQIRTDLNY